MPCKCVGICDRFLKNIKRFYGRRSSTTTAGAIRWHGDKTAVYDDRVYDRRVMKSVGPGAYYKREDYSRCSVCRISLLKTTYTSCPCCGNSKLTLRHTKGGRWHRNYNIMSGQP